MNTYKTAELEGALLDAAVAEAEGHLASIPAWWDAGKRGPWVWEAGMNLAYSGEWESGGPIIEREMITIVASTGYHDKAPLEWSASVGAYSHYIDEQLPFSSWGNEPAVGVGPTPLIAAMRAYVSKVFGESVELP